MEENRELVIKNISKIYGNKNKGDQEVVALKNVNFSINKGEFVFIRCQRCNSIQFPVHSLCE